MRSSRSQYYSSFDPRSVADCRLWIDAADASTVTLSGANVVSVRDKSSNALVFSNSVGFTYPNNTFNGSYPSFSNGTLNRANGRLGTNSSFSLAQPFTIFAAVFPGTSSLPLGSNAYLLESGAASLPASVSINNSNNATGRLTLASGLSTTYPISTNLPRIIAATGNGASSTIQYNSGTQTTGNNTNTLSNGLAIGGRWSISVPWVGHICEIIIYATAVSTVFRQQVETYLANKWGLKSFLPTLHPFSNDFSMYMRPSGGTPAGIPKINPRTVVTGCTTWWDASDPAYFTGGATWIDKSGSNNTGIQTVSGSTNMPFTTIWGNGNQAALFDRNGICSVKTTNTILNRPYTYFIVARFTQPVNSGEGEGTLFINSTDGSRRLYTDSTSFPLALKYRASIGTTSNAAGASINTVANVGQYEGFLFCSKMSNLQGARLYFNGTFIISNASYDSTSSVNVLGSAANGTSNFVFADIGEFITFNTAISDANQQQIEGYLAWKWGLETKLPVGHPYRQIKQ